MVIVQFELDDIKLDDLIFKNLQPIISKYITQRVDKEFRKIREDSVTIIKAEARSILRTILKEDIDLNKSIQDVLVSLGKNNFEPIVSGIYQELFSKITNKLSQTLTTKINLKTSDLSILTEEIRFLKYDMEQLRNRGLEVVDNEIREIDYKRKRNQ